MSSQVRPKCSASQTELVCLKQTSQIWPAVRTSGAARSPYLRSSSAARTLSPVPYDYTCLSRPFTSTFHHSASLCSPTHSLKLDDILPLSRKLHAVFEAQGLSEELYARHIAEKTTQVLFTVTITAILLSIACFCIESLPQYYERDLIQFKVLEVICVGWFTIELLIRFATCMDRRNFLKAVLNWVDIVSVLPFYVDLIFLILDQGGGGASSGLVILRVIRLTRVFRVFKLSKYNDNVQLVATTLRSSGDALRMQAFLMTIATVLFGAMFFVVEQESATWNSTTKSWSRKPEYTFDGVPDPVQSIPQGFWWAATTITGVGYGDTYPLTFQGYLVAALALYSGVLTVAFPVIILGANFTDARLKLESEREKVPLINQMRQALILQFMASLSWADEWKDDWCLILDELFLGTADPENLLAESEEEEEEEEENEEEEEAEELDEIKPYEAEPVRPVIRPLDEGLLNVEDDTCSPVSSPFTPAPFSPVEFRKTMASARQSICPPELRRGTHHRLSSASDTAPRVSPRRLTSASEHLSATDMPPNRSPQAQPRHLTPDSMVPIPIPQVSPVSPVATPLDRREPDLLSVLKGVEREIDRLSSPEAIEAIRQRVRLSLRRALSAG
eukprot:Hpha_TRINITY_DN15055_c4_g1::TRINITY_DN15055_c4_g1_i1::g.126219::m.126219/K04874/KCNA1; potassium voltage-gated channel Shaker-related subfamily A member 1